MLTLLQVAQDPHLLTWIIRCAGGEPLVARPLVAEDVTALAAFLHSLSPATRRFSTFSGYDRAMAQELCDAIARYDKLRFVIAASSGQIVGLFEFSFAITENDIARYDSYGITLDPETGCRFGPTLADRYQNQGIGTRVLPFMMDVARQFGRKRMILWGGVLADNAQAIHYYEKHGFKRVGTFQNEHGIAVVDMILEVSSGEKPDLPPG